MEPHWPGPFCSNFYILSYICLLLLFPCMLFCSAFYFSCLYIVLMIPSILKLLIQGVRSLEVWIHVQELWLGLLAAGGGNRMAEEQPPASNWQLPARLWFLSWQDSSLWSASLTQMQHWLKTNLHPIKGPARVPGIGIWSLGWCLWSSVLMSLPGYIILQHFLFPMSFSMCSPGTVTTFRLNMADGVQ